MCTLYSCTLPNTLHLCSFEHFIAALLCTLYSCTLVYPGIRVVSCWANLNFIRFSSYFLSRQEGKKREQFPLMRGNKTCGSSRTLKNYSKIPNSAPSKMVFFPPFRRFRNCEPCFEIKNLAWQFVSTELMVLTVREKICCSFCIPVPRVLAPGEFLNLVDEDPCHL